VPRELIQQLQLFSFFYKAEIKDRSRLLYRICMSSWVSHYKGVPTQT